MTRELVLLAPPSVATWYAPLGGDTPAMRVVGEGPRIAEPVLTELLLAASEGATIRVHSGHDSLERDGRLAGVLRERGATVFVQSDRAIAAGRDKVVARRLLEDASIPLTAWGVDRVPGLGEVVVKARESTQSRSIDWGLPGAELGTADYWELWTEGSEFSVVGYREQGQLSLLPVVSKGATQRDLTPPWRRARWVSPGAPSPEAEQMHELACAIASVLDIWGFFEVEFIVGDDVRVIEVNPRISGTLRLAAMAAEVPVFGAGALSARSGAIPPAAAGLEVPYDGPPFAEPGLIATSRLTCVGESVATVVERIRARMPLPPALLSGLLAEGVA